MSLFEEPRPEPQMEPEKPKRSKKKLLSIGIGAALVVAVLVTSVLVASFGQGGKPSDNVANDPQQSEIVTPDDTETPTDETPDAETPSDDQQTPADNAETPSSGTTGGKQEINPSTGKDKYGQGEGVEKEHRAVQRRDPRHDDGDVFRGRERF